MPLVTDQSNVFNLVFFATFTGQYSGSQGIRDLSSDVNPSGVSTSQNVAMDTTANVTPGFNTYYKMQGYNPITQQYEDWHSMGAPLIEPPSGHALENVSIVYTWIDR